MTVAGIALGVAVFLAVDTVNGSILGAFSDTVDRIAGKTQLEVSAGEAGLPESILEDVQTVACVEAAAPVIETVVRAIGRSEGSVLILAVDMTGDRALREYELETADEALMEDPLVFLALPDSLMLSREFADRHALKLGSTLQLESAVGPRAFTVRGIMNPHGVAGAYGGNVAVMDIYAAQHVFGRGRMFDRIDIVTRDSSQLNDCRSSLATTLGPRLKVEPPEARAQYFESMVRSLSLSTGFVSAFALLIGIFIIHNSFSTAVTQRRAEIGILRAIGATQRQIRFLFLAESAVIGAVGSLIGALGGFCAALAASEVVDTLVADLYGSTLKIDVSTDPLRLLAAIGMGITASLAGGYLPAREAAGTDPVVALQKGFFERFASVTSPRRKIAAVLLLIASMACLAVKYTPAAFYSAYAFLVLAVIVIGPMLTLLLGKALRHLLCWLRPVEGTLAADSLIHAPRRTASTVTALMLSLALAIGFAGVAKSSYESVLLWVDSSLSPDLFISANDAIPKRALTFPSSLLTKIEMIPGVREVQGVRTLRVPFHGGSVSLVAIDTEKWGRHTNPNAVEGDFDTMFDRVARGEGVIISDNLSYRRDGIQLGDTIELHSPTGALRLPVLGIVLSYEDQEGSIFLDRSLYERRWGDATVNVFPVYLTRDAQESQVREAILRVLDGRHAFLMTNQEVRGYVTGLAQQWLFLSFAQLAVAVFVALLGIVNTLTISIIDRRRELAILRAVGGLELQIRSAVWLEAIAIGLIGLTLGLALGAVNLYFMIDMMEQDVIGHRFDYTYPTYTAALLIPFILGASFLAALGPAESALQTRISEALNDE